jgi:hypothetical protein
MTKPEEPCVVTCTVNYADQDSWTDERGNIEWIDVDERRSKAAKQAAVTRNRRQQRMVYQIAKRVLDGQRIGPRSDRAIRGRGA